MNDILGPERRRLAFIESRDGKEAAIDFAKRTLKIYRTAVLRSRKRGYDNPHHASFSEYRRKFIESYRAFKAYIAANARCDVLMAINETGRIPAHSKCPFASNCELHIGGHCNHKGTKHDVPYSCAVARGFAIVTQ